MARQSLEGAATETPIRGIWNEYFPSSPVATPAPTTSKKRGLLSVSLYHDDRLLKIPRKAMPESRPPRLYLHTCCCWYPARGAAHQPVGPSSCSPHHSINRAETTGQERNKHAA
jgi:hypothetical protein